MAQSRPTNLPQTVEWVLAGLSCALVIFLIGFLVVEGLQSTGQIPILSVTAGPSQAFTGGFLVPFVVMNKGEATAASVVVEAIVSAAESTSERSEVTLDYVPAKSEATGGFVFALDPSQTNTQVRVLGYQEP